MIVMFRQLQMLLFLIYYVYRGDTCSTGYGGILCQSCSKDPDNMYYKLGSECHLCPSKTKELVKNIIGTFAILIIYYFFAKFN